MQTFTCTCGNRLFFDNTQCLACGAEVGWCESCHRLATLELAEDSADVAADGLQDYRCTHADCGALLRKCHNYAVENVCNRLFPLEASDRAPIRQALEQPDGSGQMPTGLPVEGVIPADKLCCACQLNDTIPDLSIPGHREKWARLEAAKRRLLYSLDKLGLPYAEATPRLSFDFKADVDPASGEWRTAGPGEVVYTGHCDGKITINIREADDAERERLRVTFREAHRTLIGHFRHEVGHYYWQLLVQGQREKEFKRLFGDHESPLYADAMAAYYQNGPRQDWPTSFISAYASAHPWEDFAETFALYLDVISVDDTAAHLFRSIKVNLRRRSIAPLVETFQQVGILVNEFNRTMGLIDLAPKIIAPPVVEKLEFIHKIVKSAATKHRSGAAARTAAPASAPAPLLMQQGSLRFEPAFV
jgi:hypothetical protein